MTAPHKGETPTGTGRANRPVPGGPAAPGPSPAAGSGPRPSPDTVRNPGKDPAQGPARDPDSAHGPDSGPPASDVPHSPQQPQQPRPPRPTEHRIPFPTVDEITRHCLSEDEPETVHVEIHLPARPDPDRLRRAFADAMRVHPRILMRQAPSRWWRLRYEWTLTAEPDRDPLSYPGGTLEEARRRAIADCPPLDSSPPFRAEVVEHDGGWVLLVSINHTALDGPAGLRVVATAAELYGGADNSPAPPPVRTLPPPAATETGEAATESTSPWTRPARVAADTLHREKPGNGMLISDLPVPARPPRTAGGAAGAGSYTVNDQLLVATWIMIARWNRLHEEPMRPVRITMPVDDRPRTADMPLGNGTRLVEVTFGPEERELYAALTASGAPDRAAIARLLRATGARTRALKAANRPQLGFSGDLLTKPILPVGLRAAGIRALRDAAGPWSSSTLLSNIGRIPYPLDFGDAGRAQAVWFSAPAKMPRGLSVTTVSTGGRLQVALRWSHARLDDGAGQRLGALFASALAATSSAPGDEQQEDPS